MKITYLVRYFLVFIILIFNSAALTQQSDPNLPPPEASTPEIASAKIPFVAASSDLAKDTNKDNLAWINILEEEHLVFQQNNSGRVFRGNVILFHANGENPKHQRFTYPLSTQLSELGWNTFSPNIGFPDFPRKLKESKSPEQEQPSQQSPSENNSPVNSEAEPTTTDDNSQSEPTTPKENSTTAKNDRFFETHESFQDYFTSICQETVKLVAISKEPTIILANGEASFWALDCLKKLSPQTPIVLAQPKLPSFALENINSVLDTLDNPMFIFTENDNKDDFVRRLTQRKSQQQKLRINQSALLTSKVNQENPNIAKLITGWVTTINTNP